MHENIHTFRGRPLTSTSEAASWIWLSSRSRWRLSVAEPSNRLLRKRLKANTWISISSLRCNWLAIGHEIACNSAHSIQHHLARVLSEKNLPDWSRPHRHYHRNFWKSERRLWDKIERVSTCGGWLTSQLNSTCENRAKNLRQIKEFDFDFFLTKIWHLFQYFSNFNKKIQAKNERILGQKSPKKFSNSNVVLWIDLIFDPIWCNGQQTQLMKISANHLFYLWMLSWQFSPLECHFLCRKANKSPETLP